MAVMGEGWACQNHGDAFSLMEHCMQQPFWWQLELSASHLLGAVAAGQHMGAAF